MTTARDIIYRSLRILGVTQSGQNPTSAEAADGLLALNGMLHSWLTDGVDLEFISFADLSDTVPYAEDHIEPIVFNLCIRLAPEYTTKVDEAIAAMAGRGFKMLQRQYADPGLLRVDSALLPCYGVNRSF